MIDQWFNKELWLQVQKSVVLVVAFCFCIYFGLQSMPVEMGEMIVTGSIFLAFLNLEKFEKFRGAGFEAKLKTTVEEAKVTQADLEKVRQTADNSRKELETLIQKAKDDTDSLVMAIGS